MGMDAGRPQVSSTLCLFLVLGGGFGFGQAVDFRWRRSVVAAVGVALVVEADAGFQLRVGVDERLVGFEVHFLVSDGAPEPFDEHVVQAAAFAVHRDLYPALQQHGGKLGRGELAALVGVEDFRGAVFGQRSFEGARRSLRRGCWTVPGRVRSGCVSRSPRAGRRSRLARVCR